MTVNIEMNNGQRSGLFFSRHAHAQAHVRARAHAHTYTHTAIQNHLVTAPCEWRGVDLRAFPMMGLPSNWHPK